MERRSWRRSRDCRNASLWMSWLMAGWFNRAEPIWQLVRLQGSLPMQRSEGLLTEAKETLRAGGEGSINIGLTRDCRPGGIASECIGGIQHEACPGPGKDHVIT